MFSSVNMVMRPHDRPEALGGMDSCRPSSPVLGRRLWCLAGRGRGSLAGGQRASACAPSAVGRLADRSGRPAGPAGRTQRFSSFRRHRRVKLLGGVRRLRPAECGERPPPSSRCCALRGLMQAGLLQNREAPVHLPGASAPFALVLRDGRSDHGPADDPGRQGPGMNGRPFQSASVIAGIANLPGPDPGC